MGFHSSIHQWQEAQQLTSLLYVIDGRAHRVLDLLRMLLAGKLERRKSRSVASSREFSTEVVQYRVVHSVCYDEFRDYLEEYALFRESIERLGASATGFKEGVGTNDYVSLTQQADALTREK